MDLGLPAQRHVPASLGNQCADGFAPQCGSDLTGWLRPDGIVNRRQRVFTDGRSHVPRSAGRERLGPLRGNQRAWPVWTTGQRPLLRSREVVGRRALLPAAVQRFGCERERGSSINVATAFAFTAESL